MKLKLLTTRPRPTGSEICIWDEDAKKEYTFWYKDYSDKDLKGLIKWATPLVVAEIAEQTTNVADTSKVATELSTLPKGFIDWTKENKENPQVKENLEKLIKVYKNIE